MADHDDETDPVRDAFDECVAWTDPAMVAVLAEADGQVDVCLVGFHCQCSMEPVRYAVWLSHDNRTFRVASQARELTVHFLDDDQHDLAERAGATSLDRDPSKLERLRVERDPSGSLRLSEARGWFTGTIVEVVPGGDHTAFVLEPRTTGTAGTDDHRPPLRFLAARDITPGHRVGDAS